MYVAAAVLAASVAGGVNLVWVDLADSGPFTSESAQLEATASLREAGVNARWQRGTPSQVLHPDEVAVVLMPGQAPQSQPYRRILGAAKKGQNLGAVWIYLGEVKWTLGFERLRVSALTTRQRSALARALGRVAAHETIHALLPHLPHAQTGLMSEQLDRASLLGRHLSVDSQTRDALIGIVDRRLPEAASGPFREDNRLAPDVSQ